MQHPEEKLLKLIRNKTALSTSGAAQTSLDLKTKSVKENKLPGASADVLRNINRLLVLCFLVILGYMVAHYFLPQEQGSDSVLVDEYQEKHMAKNKNQEILNSPVALVAATPFQEYETKIKQRDIFALPWEKSAIPVDEMTVASREAAFGQQLKIVGIVLDKDPKAIIEDSQSQQTYFLSEGEEINGAVIKKIEEDKVIFSYNNKTVELKP